MNPKSPRELITGSFRPTLEDALVESIRKAKADDAGAPVLVLVGSNLLATFLRRLVAERLPLWNVRFLTLAEIARQIGTPELRARGRRPLPAGAEPFLVRECIRETAHGYFEQVSDLPGFVRTAAASIRDLKEAGLRPAALGCVKGEKFAALRRIFETYENRLAKLGFHDDADLLVAAAEAAPSSNLVRQSAFIAYGFDDLNGLQRRLVLALASGAPSATAMVPWLDAPAFEYARPLTNWFTQHGFRQRPAAPCGDSLATRLFGPPAGAPLDSPPARVLSAPGEVREAREVVREVIDFAATGIPFHEIGVLLRNPEAYSHLLRDAFELSGVPCFVAGGAPLCETPAARSLEMLADLLGSDLPRNRVMQFVHFAPLDFERLIGHAPNRPHWDLLTIQAGIAEGLDNWLPRLDRLRNEKNKKLSAALKELPRLRAFMQRLLDARRSIPAEGTWSEVIGAVLRAYEQFIAPSEERSRVAAEVRKLCELDEIGDRATFADVREAIGDQLDRARNRAGEFQRGGVCIAGLLEARGVQFRAVVVPGLTEKSFPAAGKQDPILLDTERHEIARRAGEDVLLPAKSARPVEERMLFALAVSAASERVTLTYSRLDVATARERVPSHFLIRLAEAQTGERHNYSTIEHAPGFARVPFLISSGGGRPALNADDYDLATVIDLAASSRPGRVLYLARISPRFQRGIEAETARWRVPRFTRFDGIVGKTREERTADEILSPTRLEQYATCPFAYFVSQVLNVERIEDPERIEQMSAPERGSLVHRIFHRAYTACFGTEGDVPAERLAAELRHAAEEEFRAQIATGPALTWAIERQRIVRDLETYAGLDTEEREQLGARPAMFETRFGMPPRGDFEDRASTEQPLELRIGRRVLRFKGKIDRIDEVGDSDARVIDYKTGSADRDRYKDDAFLGGRALQLPIYILAAQMLRTDRNITEAAYVFPSERGGFKTVRFSRDALDDRMGDLTQIITTLEEGIEGGLFFAIPSDKHCRNCDFRDACGANIDILFERKQGDPAVADLLRLAEIQ